MKCPMKNPLKDLSCKNKIIFAVVTILILFLSFAKFEHGNPNIANQSLINKIQEGKTTKAEIIEMFGREDLEEIVGYGVDSVSYKYSVSSNIMSLFFNENMVHIDKRYNLNISFSYENIVSGYIYTKYHK